MATGEGREKDKKKITLDPNHFGFARQAAQARERKEDSRGERKKDERRQRYLESYHYMAVVLNKQRQKDGEQERDQPLPTLGKRCKQGPTNMAASPRVQWGGK